jgi:hypothetical protein
VLGQNPSRSTKLTRAPAHPTLHTSRAHAPTLGPLPSVTCGSPCTQLSGDQQADPMGQPPNGPWAVLPASSALTDGGPPTSATSLSTNPSTMAQWSHGPRNLFSPRANLPGAIRAHGVSCSPSFPPSWTPPNKKGCVHQCAGSNAVIGPLLRRRSVSGFVLWTCTEPQQSRSWCY